MTKVVLHITACPLSIGFALCDSQSSVSLVSFLVFLVLIPSSLSTLIWPLAL